MRGTLLVVGIVLYLVLGLIQLLAISAGIVGWLGVPSLLAGFVALFLAYTPIVGPIVGSFGAIKVWGWSVWSAVGLFGISFLIPFALALSEGVAEKWSAWRAPTPAPSKEEDASELDLGGIDLYEPPTEPTNPRPRQRT